ncbi:MAG: type 1 glutamine amidotransferase [Planctomycetota bacterium]
MSITVFQHDADAAPGRLGSILRDHAFKLDICKIHDGDTPPVDYDDVDAVISLGGAANVSEGHHWIAKECDYLKGAHDRGLPVLGVCLGAQLVAHALGGTVAQMDSPEVGFPEVTLNGPSAHTDTMLSGVAWTSPQFSLHEAEVTELPPGGVVLASSERCRVQAFKVGMRTYGFQYHFEATEPMIVRFAERMQPMLHRGGLTREEFAEQHTTRGEMFARLADRLCENLATYWIPRVANAVRA